MVEKSDLDHDLLLHIKGLLESFVREVVDIKGRVSQIEKRANAIQTKMAVLESTFETAKEEVLVRKNEFRDAVAELKKSIGDGDSDNKKAIEALSLYINKEDDKTRDELRRSIVTWSAIAGLVGAAAGSIITAVILLR